MIFRQNWLDVQEFIEYQKNVEQKDVETLRNFWIHLRHLLEWADDLPLSSAHEKDKPTYPAYLNSGRSDGKCHPELKDKPLAFRTQGKSCAYARMFFRWAKMEYSARYKPIRESWILTISPRKAARDSAHLVTEVDAWTLQDVLKVAALPKEALSIGRAEDAEKLEALAVGEFGLLDLSLLRARAAICFLYLSGMRCTAFISIPVSCIDIENGTIEQNPSKGVLTKFRKAAVTSFLPIPELMEAVKEWDVIVRARATKDRRWYCGVNAWGSALKDDGLLDPTKMRAKRNRLVGGMKKVCALAGVEYKSPHKLRHGHAIYGVKHAKTYQDMKAVSQNLMHANVTITDGIYGNLTGEDTRLILSGMTAGKQEGTSKPSSDLASLLQIPGIRDLLEALQAAKDAR